MQTFGHVRRGGEPLQLGPAIGRPSTLDALSSPHCDNPEPRRAVPKSSVEGSHPKGISPFEGELFTDFQRGSTTAIRCNSNQGDVLEVCVDQCLSETMSSW